EKVSQVAAAAHAPFLSAASSELLNMDSFTNLDQPRDIAKIFDSTEYAKWKGFRESEDSKYVCLTCPRVLMRLPYGKETAPVEGFNFEEGVDGTDHSKYLWGNAAFALASKMTQAFATYGWCVAIRGVEGGREQQRAFADRGDDPRRLALLDEKIEIAPSGIGHQLLQRGRVAARHPQHVELTDLTKGFMRPKRQAVAGSHRPHGLRHQRDL